MREETICKICFNLLNDIDYHLKEAQEKTDDITNKFLDKEKDPLSYKPHQLIALSSSSPRPSDLSQASLASTGDDEEPSLPSSRRRTTRHRNNKRSSNGNKEDTTSIAADDNSESNRVSKRYQPRLDEETELVVGPEEGEEVDDGEER